MTRRPYVSKDAVTSALFAFISAHDAHGNTEATRVLWRYAERVARQRMRQDADEQRRLAAWRERYDAGQQERDDRVAREREFSEGFDAANAARLAEMRKATVADVRAAQAQDRLLRMAQARADKEGTS